jgi:hypothetical protein
MAMRGTHIDRVMRELGWLIVTGVAEDRGGGCKEWHIEHVEVEDLDGRLITPNIYTLHWRRAHSVGHTAQDSDLLGFGLGMNALSWHRHRKRNGMPAAA